MNLLSTILVFGLAFVVMPFGTSWHEIPKVFVALISIAILSLSLYWRGAAWKRVSIVIVALIALSLWGLATASTPTIFFGNPFRLQGILTFWALLSICVISSQMKTVPRQSVLAWGSLLLTVLFALVGRVDPSGRAVGSVGEANSLGASLVFVLPLTNSLWAMIPALIGLFISGSRSAVIGLVAALTIWLGSHKLKRSLTVLIAGCILLASLLLPFSDARRDFESRIDIWRTAIRAGREKPLLGWGIGNVEVGLKAAAEDEQTFVRYQYVDSSHNVFLDWWVQGGVVGLTLFSILLIVSIRGLILQKETGLLASLFGILAVMLFNPVSIAILVPFWWCVGKGLHSAK